MILRRVSDGSQVRLGRQLGRGGEGTVYEIAGGKLVAKIYARAPSPNKIEKLRAMSRQATPELLRTAAWPMDLLEDHTHRVRGFLMPRVAAREDVHQLYSPKSRRRAFAQADVRFLVRTAANLARAFATMHAAGHVIGDVNHGNALIGRDGTVVLIDCDSFQVRDTAGRVFTCDVGVPLFTAPELQNRVYRGLKRSRPQDGFGLAVLLFHLLFQGRHPFAGQFAAGEMPIERAIAESRYAYGAGAAARGMSAPPLTLPVDAFGPGIAGLFERAFAEPGTVHRPEAAEWVAALSGLEQELETCGENDLHARRRDSHCCWCALEKQSGIRLFGPVAIVNQISQTSVAALWSAVQAVQRPPDDPLLPNATSFQNLAPEILKRFRLPGPADVRVSGLILGGIVAGIGFAEYFLGPTAGLVVLCAAFAGTFLWGSWGGRAARAARIEARRQLARAKTHWRDMVKRWNAECSTALFNNEVSRLRAVREQLDAWESRRLRELRLARREQLARAREQSLARHRIEDSGLDLRPEDLLVLESLGIFNAADVLRESAPVALKLPAFISHQLSTWAAALDRKYRPNRGAPLDAQVLALMEQRLAASQRELLDELRDGPAALERKRLEIQAARAELEPSMQSAWAALRMARARTGQQEID
jgi:DNA-binding helix-hairpin-helix protein with protein kinase domain